MRVCVRVCLRACVRVRSYVGNSLAECVYVVYVWWCMCGGVYVVVCVRV